MNIYKNSEKDALLDFVNEAKDKAEKAQSDAISCALQLKFQMKILADSLPWIELQYNELLRLSKTQSYIGDRCIKKDLSKLKSIINRIESLK